MILALHLAAIGGYVAAWGIQLRAFRTGRAAGRGGLSLFLLSGAVAAHGAGIAAFAIDRGTLPLVGLGPASSSLAFLMAAALLAASARAEIRPAALFVLPVVILLLGEGTAVGIEPAVPRTAFRGPWFVFHVCSIFVGYSGLLLASAAAVMYLLQFRALKRKEFGSVFRFFPSLEALDRLIRVGLYFGFPALTVGLVAGWSWTLTYGRSGLALGNPQVVLGVVTWVAYLVAIFTRLAPERRTERAAVATTAAFVLTVAAFLTLRLTTGPSGFFL